MDVKLKNNEYIESYIDFSLLGHFFDRETIDG